MKQLVNLPCKYRFIVSSQVFWTPNGGKRPPRPSKSLKRYKTLVLFHQNSQNITKFPLLFVQTKNKCHNHSHSQNQSRSSGNGRTPLPEPLPDSPPSPPCTPSTSSVLGFKVLSFILYF